MSILRYKPEKEADYCLNEILNKPIPNKAERRQVLNFKIIRHSKHYSERDKEGKDNKTAYDNLRYSRVSRENPQRQKHQRHDN